MTTRLDFDVFPFGERGFLALLSGARNDIESGLLANAAADWARRQKGVTDALAGVDSLAVRFDPATISPEAAERIVREALKKARVDDLKSGEEIEIPVLYGGEAGPDFEWLCAHCGVDAETLIELHCAQIYRVITLGFAPGFAYLGALDERLRAPRLDTPRARLPAGSVGVAGAFTGVYSLPSPGGWRIIGRSPKRLFDAKSQSPFIFTPGAAVRFRPIDQASFDALDAAHSS